jgi:hypothetical protein
VDAANADINLTEFEIDVSGGNGLVSWFADSLGANSIVNPGSFNTSGDTVYAQLAADGCFSPIVPVIIEVDALYTPDVICVYNSTDSLAFSWQDLGVTYEVSYWINGTPVSTLVKLSNSFHLGKLTPGREIVVEVIHQYETLPACHRHFPRARYGVLQE